MNSFFVASLPKNAQASCAACARFSAASLSPCPSYISHSSARGARNFDKNLFFPPSHKRAVASPGVACLASLHVSPLWPFPSSTLSAGCLPGRQRSGRRGSRLSAASRERADHTSAERSETNREAWGIDRAQGSVAARNSEARSATPASAVASGLSFSVAPSPLSAPCSLGRRVASSCTYTRAFSSEADAGSKYGPEPPQPPAGLHWSWWELYVKGVNPEYPPRQRMYAFLTAAGVDVLEMEIREIEDVTRWLEMRNVYGEKFPRFPYDVTFEDKIEALKEKYPLATKDNHD
ncbi:conserved hypothetical protein [Neospora caninum Liverpool]|uniref:Uncharacterized protein n=1 Tax=Neospora caninum (strain Liverpool) TaxID=572307 RepID=F0V8R1_NEOCL|nr:conserved hypothetical protein [Neospora caninum Liverpool]CBZ50102.1 conserved hypothetical protein [Neospora caninum Liverpool]CEL64697.1 TPA: hypothetical protein BN1204_005780 [Neospora caninum Liverpool]|eukprot:XP_003880137.1 conserved hypothetical protein [Neospora caninum Liverpool]